MGAYELQSLFTLSARPGDERIFLAWQIFGYGTTLASFTISYTAGAQGSVVYPGTLIVGLPTTILAYTLTGLMNYAWYTVEVQGWDAGGGLLVRSNSVVVMPTDLYVFLPTILRH
jgi:hypothetical protein